MRDEEEVRGKERRKHKGGKEEGIGEEWRRTE